MALVGELVEAIEDGKIVRVSSDYAKREGLFVLRKVDQEPKKEVASKPTYFDIRSRRERQKKEEEEGKLRFEDFRKPLNWRKHQVISELKDNFHWDLLEARKKRILSRKQVAQKVGVSENDIKLIESGLAPGNDFVLVNKLQEFYGINLRKDGQDFVKTARSHIGETSAEQPKQSLKERIAAKSVQKPVQVKEDAPSKDREQDKVQNKGQDKSQDTSKNIDVFEDSDLELPEIELDIEDKEK